MVARLQPGVTVEQARAKVDSTNRAATDRLPEREIMQVHTLCGHGLVSFNLIQKMIEYVRMRRLTPKEAARIMGKCCECGVFNPRRAEILLERIVGPDGGAAPI